MLHHWVASFFSSHRLDDVCGPGTEEGTWTFKVWTWGGGCMNGIIFSGCNFVSKASCNLSLIVCPASVVAPIAKWYMKWVFRWMTTAMLISQKTLMPTNIWEVDYDFTNTTFPHHYQLLDSGINTRLIRSDIAGMNILEWLILDRLSGGQTSTLWFVLNLGVECLEHKKWWHMLGCNCRRKKICQCEWWHTPHQ